jgi:hypothetical protein
MGDLVPFGFRVLGGIGTDFGCFVVLATSDLAFAERRGGGRAGFGFSSLCSGSSRAETNDEGEDGLSLLSMDMEVENRL